MLHAILHGKLGTLTPDAERLEDAVTSTVFGTLLLVERWDVLRRWLAGPHGDFTGVDHQDVWFWPTLRTHECTVIPDVCVRISNRLFVIEAKYASGRNDLATDIDDPDRILDQLVRQHVCLSAPPADRIAYSDSMEMSLSQCAVEQIFLVDARRIRKARAELKESRERESRMRVSLITWQQLDRQLFEHCGAERWATDLRRFLALEGLGAFVGFRQAVSKSVPALRRCEEWRRDAGATSGFREAIRAARRSRIDCVSRWRATGDNGGQRRRWADTPMPPAASVHIVGRWRSDRSTDRRTDGGN